MQRDQEGRTVAALEWHLMRVCRHRAMRDRLPAQPQRDVGSRLRAILHIQRLETGSSLTLRWRELDSNLRFRARAGSILPVRFVADSLLEESGLEPSVALAIPGNLFRMERDYGFEFAFLQQ
jgi:hypothetical protein